MKQDILCRGIVRVSRVCMHSNEPFIMGCVVCVRCVPPVDTTAHRVDKAPHPARRRAAEVRSRVPRCRVSSGALAVASAVTRVVVPARARGGAPVTSATARDAASPTQRDLARKRFPTFRKMKDLETRPAEGGSADARAATRRRPRAAATGGARLAVLAPRFLARSNEVSCRHQKSTSQF